MAMATFYLLRARSSTGLPELKPINASVFYFKLGGEHGFSVERFEFVVPLLSSSIWSNVAFAPLWVAAVVLNLSLCRLGRGERHEIVGQFGRFKFRKTEIYRDERYEILRGFDMCFFIGAILGIIIGIICVYSPSNLLIPGGAVQCIHRLFHQGCFNRHTYRG